MESGNIPYFGKNKYQKPLVLLFAVLFVFHRVQAAVIINEVMFGEKDFAKNEFIEFYNTSDSAISLEKYKLTKKTASGSESNLVSSSKFFGTISGHGYFVVSHPGYKDEIEADLEYSGSSYSIAADNSILLYDSAGKLIDTVGWGKASFFEKVPAPNFEENESLGRLDGEDSDDNYKDFSVQNPTPGVENKKIISKDVELEPEIKKEYSKSINITELFPNPSQSQYEEYIELYNGSDEKIDLKDWTLHDASKSGKYTFSESLIIEARKYLAIFKNKFKFALNNSGNESIVLLDPNGIEVVRVEYSGSKKDASYNFDGAKWRWSKFLTPNAENILNNEPVGTLKVDDEIYVDVYANFSISTTDGDGDNVKVTWDFGDGHKSYLAKTKHKFKKTGKYAASVKFGDGSEDVVKNFEINVEEFPHPEVKIILINANPAGADTGVESITLQNKEKKKINLNGWSIATGWKKKFVNHPIKEDVVIKGKKEKEITSNVSSFTLNNTKAKIQLRYPDGEVAHEVKYKSPNKTIADGEIYQKEKGKKWQWISGVAKPVARSLEPEIQNLELEMQNLEPETQNVEPVTQNVEPEMQNIEPKSQNPEPLTQSPGSETQKLEDVEIELSKVEVENKLLSANNDFVKIELLKSQPSVLGASTVRQVDGQYFFTPDAAPQEHYATMFFKSTILSLNAKLNNLLNYFSK